MLEGKKILLGVTGSIAAYKAAVLVRLLVKDGAEVQVLMTPASRDFITPLTLSTLSRRPVLCALSEAGVWTNHVELGRWADLMVVAPASANTLARMAAGLSDNLLVATYLSAACPVVIAPAMDVDMWRHPATRDNVGMLTARGNILVEVASGELASGLTGEGRMQEPEVILSEIRTLLGVPGPLSGRQALVTAGPTHEPLDPVRFIGNHSSGKMGIAVARELARAGSRVDLVLGPVEAPPPMAGVTVHPVTTAAEMFERCGVLAPASEIVVMAAAVADYRPAAPLDHKMKKKEDSFSLALERTPDVLRELGRVKRPGQFLCGFALETDHEEAHAVGKLKEKNLDMIVLNSLNDPGAGFQGDTNKVTIFTAAGTKMAFPLKSKTEVARDIVKVIAQAFLKEGR